MGVDRQITRTYCAEPGCDGAGFYSARCMSQGHQTVDVVYVPCDDAAVQRATEAVYELSRGQSWPGLLDGIKVDHVGIRNVAEAVLRAAGGQDA
jgi:hypothetical protein